MREGVDEALRRGRAVAIPRDEHLCRRAERHERIARIDRADTNRAGRDIASAGCDDDRMADAPGSEIRQAQVAGGRGAFVQRGQMRGIKACRGDERLRPVALCSSSNSMPAASTMSVAYSPVRRKRT